MLLTAADLVAVGVGDVALASCSTGNRLRLSQPTYPGLSHLLSTFFISMDGGFHRAALLTLQ